MSTGHEGAAGVGERPLLLYTCLRIYTNYAVLLPAWALMYKGNSIGPKPTAHEINNLTKTSWLSQALPGLDRVTQMTEERS